MSFPLVLPYTLTVRYPHCASYKIKSMLANANSGKILHLEGKDRLHLGEVGLGAWIPDRF